jgi:hypothetical protein
LTSTPSRIDTVLRPFEESRDDRPPEPHHAPSALTPSTIATSSILSVLSREGRISKTELAERVHLSATACWDRMKRLEAAGLIRGYHADVALAGVAPHVVVFVTVELESHRPENFQSFERAVALATRSSPAWALGGGVDYLSRSSPATSTATSG